ncbi:HAD family hydrolase [Gluconobacter wancherniae]|nr:HAD family hydrolase [Gluconobacter wancherniae]
MARLLSEASKKPEQTWQLRSEDSNCLLLVNRDAIPQAGTSSLTWQEWKEYLLGAGKLSQISLPGKLWFPPQQSESNDSFKQLERPAVFLDRDGVINEDHGWVGTRERFHWTPNLFGALRRLTDFGYHVFIVTNQSGIARGFYTETDLHDLMTWVVDEIRKHGGTIDDWRFCPFHPNASIEQYRKTSNWRKPAPGMILDLASKWKPDLSRSVLYGDQETDLQAAINSGIPAVKVGPETLASFVDSSFPKPSV